MDQNCHICGEPLDSESLLFCTCRYCGRPFHMALTEGSAIRDCGQVVIGEETMAMQFTCNLCLQEIA